jgi:hypothetical protein
MSRLGRHIDRGKRGIAVSESRFRAIYSLRFPGLASEVLVVCPVQYEQIKLGFETRG